MESKLPSRKISLCCKPEVELDLGDIYVASLFDISLVLHIHQVDQYVAHILKSWMVLDEYLEGLTELEASCHHPTLGRYPDDLWLGLGLEDN